MVRGENDYTGTRQGPFPTAKQSNAEGRDCLSFGLLLPSSPTPGLEQGSELRVKSGSGLSVSSGSGPGVCS